MVITNLRDQLIRDEGCKLTAYKDTLGNWTVGVGHEVDHFMIIDQDTADDLLIQDIQTAVHHISSWIWVEAIDQIREDVLTNMCFNMGFLHLSGFHHFLGYMQSRDWAQASKEMLNSEWAKQVGPRATRLSQQVLTGTYQ